MMGEHTGYVMYYGMCWVDTIMTRKVLVRKLGQVIFFGMGNKVNTMACTQHHIRTIMVSNWQWLNLLPADGMILIANLVKNHSLCFFSPIF